jgi:4-amino-4-deoxy-L-arabinose transferase-like glycosyltransferase
MSQRANEQLGKWAIGGIILTFLILGAVYSVVIPLFEAPDEIWHYSFVKHLADGHGLPCLTSSKKDVWLREGGQPPLYYFVAAMLTAPIDTNDFPGYVRFNKAHPNITPGSSSSDVNVFIHTDAERFPYRGSPLAVHLIRLLSVLWGAVAVVGTYALGRQLFPRHPSLALSAAALCAFNPQFIFISSVVNNDSLVTALATLVLYLAVRLAQGRESRWQLFGISRGHSVGLPNLLGMQRDKPQQVGDSGLLLTPTPKDPRWQTAAWLGLALGGALLSKMSAPALLPLCLLALSLAWWRDRDWRALVTRAGLVYGLALAVAGWWYARNWLIYGDPLAWEMWTSDIAARVPPPTLVDLLGEFWPAVQSFWAVFGWTNLFAGKGVYFVVAALGAAATIGLVRFAIGRMRRRSAADEGESAGLLLVGCWFLIIFASLVQYMRTTPASQGRLLFPAIAAVAVLMALGLGHLVSARWRGMVLSVFSGILLILAAVIPFCTIVPAYARPVLNSIAAIPAQASALDVNFESRLGLRGYRLDGAPVTAGEAVSLTLYWEALADLDTECRVVVRLLTPSGRLVGQTNALVGSSLYPSDLWRQGDVVYHTLSIATDPQAEGPALGRIVVSVYTETGGSRQQFGDDVTIGVVRLLIGSGLASNARPGDFRLGEQVTLIGYKITPEIARPDAKVALALYWRAESKMNVDYTVFVHLIDGEGRSWEQSDSYPAAGDYPTTAWEAGEIVEDRHELVLPADIAPGVYRIEAGMYDLQTLQRLPAFDAAGHRLPDDRILLPTSVEVVAR